MNKPFKTWKATLETYNKRAPAGAKIEFRRLSFSENNTFDFFNRDGLGNHRSRTVPDREGWDAIPASSSSAIPRKVHGSATNRSI